MEQLIAELKSRLKSVDEELFHAELNGETYTEGYRLAKRERKVLAKTIERLTAIEIKRALLQ